MEGRVTLNCSSGLLSGSRKSWVEGVAGPALCGPRSGLTWCGVRGTGEEASQVWVPMHGRCLCLFVPATWREATWAVPSIVSGGAPPGL